MSVRITDSGKVYYMGTMIGWIEGDTYVTPRSEKTFFRKTQSFNIQTEILKAVEAKGARKVNFLYRGKTGEKPYITTVENLWKQETIYVEGWGEQKVFPVRGWKNI